MEITKKLEKYLEEAYMLNPKTKQFNIPNQPKRMKTGKRQKWTGNEEPVAKEIDTWASSLKWAAEQVRQAQFDNALESLEKVKKMSGRLVTAVKNLKKDSEYYLKTGEIKKKKYF